jgi:hypothetical protein
MYLTYKAFENNIDPNLVQIDANYIELLVDDDPMLYTGTSGFGNRIIGSIIEDNRTEKVLKYFHVIVNDFLFEAFLKEKLSLKELFDKVGYVYILTFHYDGNLEGVYGLNIANVPKAWLPLENSYCPNFIVPASLKFSSSLKGGIADTNLALPADAIEFNNFTSCALNGALGGLSQLNYRVQPLYAPAKTGSYKLDFNLTFNAKEGEQIALTTESISEQILGDYFSKFFDLVFNKLPSQSHNNVEDIDGYSTLLDALRSVYSEECSEMNDKAEEILLKSIQDVIKYSEKLTARFGRGFDRLEFNGYGVDETIYNIATVKHDYFQKASNYLVKENLIEDDQYKDFEIRVYDINSDTLKCKAWVFYSDNEGKDKAEKATIKHGLQSLDNSKFSNSVDKNLRIKISGKGKYRGTKIIEIEAAIFS